MKAAEISKSEATDKFLTTLHSWTDFLLTIQSEKNQPRTIEMAAQAFAAKMMLTEMQARGLSVRKAASTEDISRACLIRLYDWLLARLEAYILLSEKEIPEAQHPEADFAAAAYLAATFWEQNRETEIKKLSSPARKKFERELSKPTRAKWNCPQLDMWLVSIWPIVTTYDWTYRGVWQVAASHPEIEECPALERVATLAKHCKNLNLRLTQTASKASGRAAKNQESKLPDMADVALKCRAILPADSPDCFQKSRK